MINKILDSTDFRGIETITICPKMNNCCIHNQCEEPEWQFTDKGRELWQGKNTRASVGLGEYWFSEVSFSGTFYVGPSDADWVGFVFAYQSDRNFYVFSSAQLKIENGEWRGCEHSWSLRRVQSQSGSTNTDLGNALTAAASVVNQTRTVWQDLTGCKGWKPERGMRWELFHRPQEKRIRIRIYDGQLNIVRLCVVCFFKRYELR